MIVLTADATQMILEADETESPDAVGTTCWSAGLKKFQHLIIIVNYAVIMLCQLHREVIMKKLRYCYPTCGGLDVVLSFKGHIITVA